MKFTSVTRGIGYIGGTSDVVEVYPIASNIRQEFIITEIGSATSVLVRAMRSANGINPVEVGSSTFSASKTEARTPDRVNAYPKHAARIR